MPKHPNLTYTYDGTYEGFLCCVFESYEQNEIPCDILPPDTDQISLTPTKNIVTNLEKAARVQVSIPKKMGSEMPGFLSCCFLTCLEGKEILMLDLMRQGYQYGPRVMDHWTNDTVYKLQRAVGHLSGESHKLKGFIRFSIHNGILVSVIHPKNIVLPLLRDHFCDRYQNETFLIYDEAHGMALVYRPYEGQIIPMDNLILNEPDEEEQKYRELWKEYYATIAIKERENPICRRTLMPKRYWDYMTEFDAPAIRKREKPLSRMDEQLPSSSYPVLPPDVPVDFTPNSQK